MKSITLASILAITGITTAQAELYDYSTTTNKIYPTTTVVKEVSVVTPTVVSTPKQHPLDVSVLYRNDKAIDKEGTEASVQYQLNDKVSVGANIFGNEDDVISYGANVGVPFTLTDHQVRVIPYVGLEQYNVDNAEDATALNVGFKTYTPIYKTFQVTTDVKYVRGTENKDDLNDVSYSIGLSKKF